MKFRRWIVAALLLGVSIFAYIFYFVGIPRVKHRLELGVEKEGVIINLMEDGSGVMPVEVGEYLTFGPFLNKTKLTHFAQLQDEVQISSKEEALKFVRLRTSYRTRFLWGKDGELEVTTPSQAALMPTFGLPEEVAQYSSFNADTPASGTDGILSTSAFRSGGFKPPLALQTVQGFEVIRWTYWFNGVQKIRELVGQNGSYRRIVIGQEPPPKLPGTTWRVPRLR